MKRVGYIVLFLLSIGIRLFAPAQALTVHPVSTTDCVALQDNHHELLGIQGEPLTIAGEGSAQISVPTHFCSIAHRVTFSKNRTRTAFLRKMIRHYQPVYLVFRGKERLETSPFATPVGSTYYVYGLRRILC